LRKLFIFTLFLALPAWSQTTQNGRVQTGTNALKPTTCSPGDQYNATDTFQLLECGPANTWVPKVNGSIGGATTEIQYNLAGALAGDPALTWNTLAGDTGNSLNVGNVAQSSFAAPFQNFFTGLNPAQLVSVIGPTAGTNIGIASQVQAGANTGISWGVWGAGYTNTSSFALGIEASTYVDLPLGVVPMNGNSAAYFFTQNNSAANLVGLAQAVDGIDIAVAATGSGSLDYLTGVHIQHPTHSGLGAITNNIGYFVEDQVIGTNNFAYYAAAQTVGANNWGFYSDATNKDHFGALTAKTISTITNCAANGSAANPSIVACSAAAAGMFSCSTTASTGTCQVNTSAVTANSEIFITQDAADGGAGQLNVTCNTNNVLSTTKPLLVSKNAGVSFTINLGTVSVNPACFEYNIVN